MSAIWVPAQAIGALEEQVWCEVSMVGRSGGQVTVVGRRGEKRLDIHKDLGGEICECNPHGLVAPDMTSLHHIHEPAIMHNLMKRFEGIDGQICPYSLMASVLVAVNPLEPVPSLPMQQYRGKPLGTEPPHPWQLAEQAYQLMALPATGQNQSIVISGESGAGKTETSKLCLAYLAGHSNATGDRLDRKLIESNPILESFGNAQTLRNHNSSRFGKFMRLLFDKSQRSGNNGGPGLVGAMVETYLLERSRLTHCQAGERSFHVMYQMLNSAARVAGSEAWSLRAPQEYLLLSQPGQSYTHGLLDDSSGQRELVQALGTQGLDAEGVLRMVAGVLTVGNIAFKADHSKKASGGGDAAVIDHADELALAAKLLGCDAGELERCLLERVIKAGGETVTAQRTPKDAALARDALIRASYTALFDGVVAELNLRLNPSGGMDSSFIGVLDIFGFECFDTNGLAQLLINYANEELHALFVRRVIDAESKLYESEGLSVSTASHGKQHADTSAECVGLLAGREGVLWRLDEQCKVPEPSDPKFLSELHRGTKKCKCWVKVPHQHRNHVFAIQHYAAAVTYTVVEDDGSSRGARGGGTGGGELLEGRFIAANSDALPADLHSLITSSTSSSTWSLGGLFADLAGAGGDSSDSSGRRKKKKKQHSVSAKFSRQISKLIQALEETSVSYTCCVKPNSSMRPKVFENGYVCAQLRALGITRTCEVLRLGLPTRIDYSHIRSLIAPSLPSDIICLFEKHPPRRFVAAALFAMQVPMSTCCLGTTKLFFRTGQVQAMQDLLQQCAGSSSLGPAMRKHLMRHLWRTAFAAVRAQRAFIWLLRRARMFAQQIRAAGCVQRGFRCYVARKELGFRRAQRERERREAEQQRLAAEAEAARLQQEQEIERQQGQEDGGRYRAATTTVVAASAATAAAMLDCGAAPGQSEDFGDLSEDQLQALISAEMGGGGAPPHPPGGSGDCLSDGDDEDGFEILDDGRARGVDLESDVDPDSDPVTMAIMPSVRDRVRERMQQQHLLEPYDQLGSEETRMLVRAYTLHEVGAVLDSRGNRDGALRYLHLSLRLQRSVWARHYRGVGDACTLPLATSLHDMGMVLNDKGDCDAALAYLGAAYRMLKFLQEGVSSEESDQRREAVQAAVEEQLPATLHELGRVHAHLGRHSEALQYLEESLALNRRVHSGKAHAGIAATLHVLGRVYNALTQHFAALEHLEEALEMKKALHGGPGASNSALAITHHAIGMVLVHTGNNEGARKHLTKALEMKRSSDGRYVPESGTATTLHVLGSVMAHTGHTKEALESLEQSLAMKQKLLGPDGSSAGLAATLHVLGRVRRASGDLTTAEQNLTSALQMKRSVHGQHTAVAGIASSLYELGATYNAMVELADAAKALPLLEEALAMRKSVNAAAAAKKSQMQVQAGKSAQSYVRPDPEEVAILHELAISYARLGQRQEAMAYAQNALVLCERIVGGANSAHHPTVKALKQLQTQLNKRGKIKMKSTPTKSKQDQARSAMSPGSWQAFSPFRCFSPEGAMQQKSSQGANGTRRPNAPKGQQF